MAVAIFCGILAMLFLIGYLWPPLSLAAAVAFLIIGLLVTASRRSEEDHKIGGTDY
jgi:hypothetical protein